MTKRAVVAAAVLALLAACSVGEGTGEVHSDELIAPPCFQGPYDLKPSFFASNPYRDTQTIRIQRGDDLTENSDGVEILVDSTSKARSMLGQPMQVGLPVGVAPPGVPIKANPDPPTVHLTLYLHSSCHTADIALEAVSGTVTFAHLFDGDPNESHAADKLIQGSFDVMVGDPHDEPPGGGAIPDSEQSHLTGDFRFYFQRGQPGQPFP